MSRATDEIQVRGLLDAKLADVEEQLTTMVKPPTEQGNISFGKRVGDGTQMAVDRLTQVAVHDRLQVVREDTIRALAKLDEGSYGRCVVFGQTISPERLDGYADMDHPINGFRTSRAPLMDVVTLHA